MGYDDLETQDNSNYLKIEPNTKVQFCILSPDAEKKVTHWIEKQPFSCDGKGCSNCSEGNKPRKSWSAKVFDRGSGKIKEFEFGVQIANQLKNIAAMMQENQKTIHDVDIRVTREGSGMDTEYLVLHVDKKPLPDDLPPF